MTVRPMPCDWQLPFTEKKGNNEMNKVTKIMAITATVVGLSFGFANKAEAKHTVKPGDTLSKLATEYKTTVPAISKANPHITDINLIFVGEVLEGIGNEKVKANHVQRAVVSKPQVVTKVTPQYTAPKQETKVYKKFVTQTAPTTQQQPTGKVYTKEVEPTDNGSEQSAKEWIAYKESRGDYNARSATSKYVGRYQLDKSYLNGDYSPANQEKTVSIYVKNRYGSWQNAKRHHEKFGWY